MSTAIISLNHFVIAGFSAVTSTLFCLICLHISIFQISKYHTLSSAILTYALDKFVTILAKITLKRSLSKAWKHPQKSQEKFLLKLLKTNAPTEYGKRYQFDTINSVSEFQKRHPISTYDQFKEYVAKMAKGETNVLTVESPTRFCLTSGTTGEGKMIPVVPSYETSILTHASSFTSKTLADHFSDGPLQKAIWFYTAPKMRTTEGGHELGPMSRIKDSMKKILVGYSGPPEAYDIQTLHESIYVHLLFGLRDPGMSKIIAGFTTTFYNAMKQLESEWPQLVEDIRTGQLSADLHLPQSIRKSLEEALDSDPDRANELEVEFQKGFDGILRRVWHNLVCVVAIDIGGHKERLLSTYAKGNNYIE